MTIRDSIERLEWEIQEATKEITRLRAMCSHPSFRTLESDDMRDAVGYQTFECLDCMFRWRETV
jgi:hypothetical protein